MPTETLTETIAVGREEVLDAIAALDAAGHVLCALNGNMDSEMAQLFWSASTDLRVSAFGPLPDDDDEYDRDPINVETYARHCEKVVEAFREFRRPEPLERAMSDDDHYFIQRSIERRAASARRIREQGTIAPSGADDGP